MQWISFKHKKPEHEQIVLCYDEVHNVQIVCKCLHLEDKIQLNDIYGPCHEADITYWMPLPITPDEAVMRFLEKARQHPPLKKAFPNTLRGVAELLSSCASINEFEELEWDTDRAFIMLAQWEGRDKWISVDDALPVEHVGVLACDMHNPEDGVYIDYMAWDEETPDWIMKYSGPTHWMPLPEKKHEAFQADDM